MYIDSTNKMKPDGDLYVAAQLQLAFEDLLVDFHVDVTLHGHHHSYQRTCPVIAGECVGYGADGVANGPVHLVVGNAGAGLCLNIHERTPKVWCHHGTCMQTLRTLLEVADARAACLCSSAPVLRLALPLRWVAQRLSAAAAAGSGPLCGGGA